MSFCRQGHTLVDNEAEVDFSGLVPGTFFTLDVNSVIYFGIVDEYSVPTATTLVCRLYDDAGRTVLNVAPVALGVTYSLTAFVKYSWDAKDVFLANSDQVGTWISPPVNVRDDFGFWTGAWTATPMVDQAVQFNFDGTYSLFAATADGAIGQEIPGAGLGAGTYTYCVTPVDGGGRLGAGSRTITVTLAGAADIRLDWIPNDQVTSWNIYGRTSPGSFGLITNVAGSITTFTDDGSLPPATGSQPALFEEAGWTVAVPNKTVNLVDENGIVTDAVTNELGIEKRDDGIVLSDAEGIGTSTVNNAGNTFDITNLESTSNTILDAVIDPNVFTNVTGPIEDEPPIILTFDQHIFLNSDGYKTIVEQDGSNDTITTTILNTDTGFAEVEITNAAGDILGTSSILLTELFDAATEPDLGHASTKITYEDFEVLGDGTITGSQTIELNTYDAVVTTPPSGGNNDLVIYSPPVNVFTDDPRILVSNDGGQTYSDDFDPLTRITLPVGPNWRLHSTGGQLVAGEGWYIMTEFNSSPQDIAFAWTTDITELVWSFQDASGRGLSIADALDWVFGFNSDRADIVKMANGKVVHYHLGNNSSSGTIDVHQFFYPASGVFYNAPVMQGSNNMLAHALWREKNKYLFIVLDDIDNSAELWTADFGTSEVTPLTNFVSHGQLMFPEETGGNLFMRFITSPTRAILVWRSAEFHHAWYSDDAGATWQVQTPVAPTGDFESEPLWSYMSGGTDISYSRELGKFFVRGPIPQVNNETNFTHYISDSDDGFIFTQIGDILDRDTTFQTEAVGYWKRSADNQINDGQPGWPALWDGTRFITWGPDPFNADEADSLRHFDINLVDSGTAFALPPSTTQDWDEDILSFYASESVLAVPEDVIFANIRPYIPQRPVRTPREVVPGMPFPAQISDTSGPVYDSQRTYSRRTPDGFTIDVTITSFVRGGLGNTTSNRMEDGHHVTEVVHDRTPNLNPNPSRVPFGWRTPVPSSFR